MWLGRWADQILLAMLRERTKPARTSVWEEFTCRDCGFRVFRIFAFGREPASEPVCAVCRKSVRGNEMMRSVSVEEFARLKAAARPAYPGFAYPTVDPNARCFISNDGNVGACIYPNGEICHLFSFRNMKPTERNGINKFLLESGGTIVKSFDGALFRYYRRLGYVEIYREKFDPSIAPRDWNYADFGSPDIVTMKWPS